jgi:hypothetical protein
MTEWAEDRGAHELKQVVRRVSKRLMNVNTSALTDIERKHNADALARTAAMGGLVSKTYRLESVGDGK